MSACRLSALVWMFSLIVSLPPRGQDICSPASCLAFKSPRVFLILSVILFSSFRIHNRAGVYSVYHAKRRATVPCNVYRADVIHMRDRSHRAGFQIAVWIIHADQLHPAAAGITSPQVGQFHRCYSVHAVPLHASELPAVHR